MLNETASSSLLEAVASAYADVVQYGHEGQHARNIVGALCSYVAQQSAHVLCCREHPYAKPVYYIFEDHARCLQWHTQFTDEYLMRGDRKFTQMLWGSKQVTAPWVRAALESLEERFFPAAAPPALQARVAVRPEHMDEIWTRNMDEIDNRPARQQRQPAGGVAVREPRASAGARVSAPSAGRRGATPRVVSAPQAPRQPANLTSRQSAYGRVSCGRVSRLQAVQWFGGGWDEVWWWHCVASLWDSLQVWWSIARRYPHREHYDVWVLWALAYLWYAGLLIVRTTGVYAGVRRVHAKDWTVVPLRGVVISLACWSRCAEAILLVILAWLWVYAGIHADDMARQASHTVDIPLDVHGSRDGQGWTVPSLRWSQVFLLGRVHLPALPARLDKPRFAARWAQLRRNLQLHRVAQAAYLALVLALVVFTAAGGSSRLTHGGWRVMACFFASNPPVAAVRFNRILRFFLLLCGILWVAGKLKESVPAHGAMPPTQSAWGASPCTSWEAQQSSRQWEPGWEANVAEQDEVLPYTVLDELQPLGDTTVTKDEAAWLDTELNATFGGHPDFKKEHWAEMRAVLRRCKSTFANTPHDLTGYKGKAEHNTFSIPFTDESKAAYQRPRKYSPGEQEIIDIHCKELLEYGFIEPAAKHCRHASNVVVAGKTDHETGLWTQTRFCVDLRGVNRHSLKDNTLPHRPEELYQKVAKAKFKTTLDATKAFHQIPMATEEDRSKTAFWWKNQLYQYTSMPFGAAGATFAFVGIMDYELRKSTFGAATVDFLGYRIGHNSIGAQEAKCKAIQELPRPQDKTGLRSILGMMNYYKGLVGEPGGANYSEMARPLNDLLKKEITDIKGAWGKEQDQALQDLKDSLYSGRCLRPIDYDRPLILYTDWSTYGIGAVLGQKDDDGKEYICMAISRLHGVGEVYTKDFCDSLCFMLAGDTSPGEEATPEVQVANYCKMTAVELADFRLTLFSC
ncbi:hypothetical protein CYMTET_40162 [Cymbomonas tetramitiformis]|uniref:Reverse transcriptase/retrotransposon-derived protein RNase H-like domain-containing protein n=1 Tax=Cymbomonas tetramitiformis TaxID=36881 RepID=A0AAE0C9V2_9CHLO|nr:hypothetical protein CYMTET_40162 [Cymbomonas tetramitiformis]